MKICKNDLASLRPRIWYVGTGPGEVLSLHGFGYS
jgi:hypothetical protein